MFLSICYDCSDRVFLLIFICFDNSTRFLLTIQHVFFLWRSSLFIPCEHEHGQSVVLVFVTMMFNAIADVEKYNS